MKLSEFHIDMVALVNRLIPTIDDGYCAYEPEPGDDSGIPSMLLTIGADADGWAYQTGDNSFTGGAYGFADWSSVAIYRDSDPVEVANEIISGFPDDFEFEPEDGTP